MLSWVVAIVVGAGGAVVLYAWREGRFIVRHAPLAALRAIAIALVIALLLDAPAGPRRPLPPLVALDVSESWLRGGDSARWRSARQRARALATDSLLVFGDSVRESGIPRTPDDAATRARALAERALGAGRPLVVITDGEIDDPAALPSFPAGSRTEVLAHPPARDVGIVSLDAPRAAVSGDTVEMRVTLRNGALAAPAGTLTIELGGKMLARTPIDSLAARAERSVAVRAPISGPVGPALLAAIVQVPGDVEPRNDTLMEPVDIARAAGAVLASTSPDFDARFVLPVLRGAVALPTRAYYRVAPGQWRQDGSLAPVSEAVVRGALRDAPLAIIHGDTGYFGAPRSATTGSVALLVPATDTTGEWYPVAAPPSPLSAALAGIDWDSLPPVSTSARPPTGEWEGLLIARAREYDRRAAIAGSSTGAGRRVVVVTASGFWRWQFRGGSSADAYAALWGSIFDWLTAERPDARAAIPAEGAVRAGDVIRWRRGGGGATDSVVVAVLTRRGTTRVDSVTLHFGGGATLAESDPLPPGVYDVRVPGGAALLAVNASRELLPRSPVVRAGAVGGAVAAGDQPRVRDAVWPYVILIGALCIEWLWRRRIGLS